MFRFVFVFCVCLGVLFWLDLLQSVQADVILPFTTALAHICVALMHPFDATVAAHNNEMINTVRGGGISIVAGCSGVEAVLILVSAVLAFPAPWKHRIIGILVGFFAIQALNLIRLISLYYMQQWNPVWFNWFHLYLWQALIILDALVFWLIWLRWVPREMLAPASLPTGAPV